MLIRFPLVGASAGPLRKVALGLLVIVASSAIAWAVPDASRPWQSVQPANDREPTARHESGVAAVDGRLWLFGGRGNRPVEVFDPVTSSWRSAGAMPLELNHFQPAVIDDKVYLVGAFTGGYPNETSVADIHVFDTQTESWSIAGRMPTARVRGSVATAVRDGWIYVLGGNTQGHNGGAVAWSDRWRPADDTWEILADAPHARDHFSAAFVDGLLISTGGRQTEQPNPYINAVAATDIYDPATGRWSSGASIPTVRAGTMVTSHDGELIVAGGEIGTSGPALDTVEAYDAGSDTWRSLQPMIEGRHSGGGAVLDKRFHVVSGSGGRGGGPELGSHETLSLISSDDTDEDGLSDADERDLYGTDPSVADTDGDGLEDGDEIGLGTDPLLTDSDVDGLDDGNEVTDGTDPLVADSDDDGLDDGAELALGTDPNVSDSDGDTLLDGAEVATHGTDPNRSDSDDDTLLDGDELAIHGTDPTLRDTDGDALDDALEIDMGTDPLLPDSDGDGVDDGVERQGGTDPLLADSDADGLDDGDELAIGSDPLVIDSDEDGLADGEEVALGTDPTIPDTDGDGVLDGDDVDPTNAPRKRSGGGTSGGGLLIGLLITAWGRRRR